MPRLLTLSLLLAGALALVARTPPLRRAHLRPRASATRALYEDDPWLTSGEAAPWSDASVECLFRYGPIVYFNRCFQSDEYNASVRKVKDRFGISRALAEQEINTFLADATSYLASGRQKRKPKEEELLPPVGIVDKALVIAWVIILVPAIRFILVSIPEGPPPTDGLFYDAVQQPAFDAATATLDSLTR